MNTPDQNRSPNQNKQIMSSPSFSPFDDSVHRFVALKPSTPPLLEDEPEVYRSLTFEAKSVSVAPRSDAQKTPKGADFLPSRPKALEAIPNSIFSMLELSKSAPSTPSCDFSDHAFPPILFGPCDSATSFLVQNVPPQVVYQLLHDKLVACAHSSPSAVLLSAASSSSASFPFSLDLDVASKWRFRGHVFRGSQYARFQVHFFVPSKFSTDLLVEFQRRTGDAFLFYDFFHCMLKAIAPACGLTPQNCPALTHSPASFSAATTLVAGPSAAAASSVPSSSSSSSSSSSTHSSAISSPRNSKDRKSVV